MSGPENTISLYRAIQVPKTSEGLDALKAKGLTMSNHSEAQYSTPDLFDDLTDWSEMAGNPNTKVNGLPVFLNMSEAVGWIRTRKYRDDPNSPTPGKIPIIAHASLPQSYFQSQEERPALVSVHSNDLHGSTRKLPYAQLLKHRDLIANGYAGTSITRYRGEWGEHYIPRPYPIDAICADADQNKATPGYTRFYTPSYYLNNGGLKLPYNTKDTLEVSRLVESFGDLVVPSLVEVTVDQNDDETLYLRSLLDR